MCQLSVQCATAACIVANPVQSCSFACRAMYAGHRDISGKVFAERPCSRPTGPGWLRGVYLVQGGLRREQSAHAKLDKPLRRAHP